MDGIKAKFVEAWGACENPELDSVNPHFRNKYASLKATLKAVRTACVPRGIAYIQKLTVAGDGSARELASYVTDGSEMLELSRFPVECPPNPQGFGSNLTYAKRQQAQADWGITGEPDDDGEAAAQHAARKPEQTPKRRTGTTASSEPKADGKDKWLERCAQLKAQCVRQGVKVEGLDSWYSAYFGDVNPDDLTSEQIVAWGKYLAEMARDSEHLMEEQQ